MMALPGQPSARLLHRRRDATLLLGVLAVQCYRALREWTLRKQARPLAQKGFELGRQGRSEEAIAAYDEFSF